jgi:hypothetical protein
VSVENNARSPVPAMTASFAYTRDLRPHNPARPFRKRINESFNPK